jgi:hypothetical protein
LYDERPVFAIAGGKGCDAVGVERFHGFPQSAIERFGKLSEGRECLGGGPKLGISMAGKPVRRR